MHLTPVYSDMTEIRASIVPNLWFDREAEQAAEHYISAFGGNGRILNTIASHPDSPSPQDVPVVVEFELAGQRLVGINGGPQFTFNEAVSLEARVTGQEQLDRLWAALVDGGEELPCGWLKDKYGLAWQITPTEYYDLLGKGDAEGDSRLMAAVLSTHGKFDIAELQAAYKGS
ncbi:VOC family protein [Mycobacterium sp. 48b]|uniref:VOC family protein n=1 Tax=Mycobacterium sp. 48b TaxID=3400426 RepID=UPI003AAC2DDD